VKIVTLMREFVNASRKHALALTSTGTGTPSLISLFLIHLVQVTHAQIRPNWTVTGVIVFVLERLDQEPKHFEDLTKLHENNVGLPLSEALEVYLETFAEDHSV